MDLPSLQELFEKYINQAVRETNSTSDHQLCYLLNGGLAGMLDVARAALKETTSDIIEYATALSSMHGEGGRSEYLDHAGIDLRVKFTNAQKFVLVPKSTKSEKNSNNAKKIPASLISIGSAGYTTVDLVRMRLGDSMCNDR